MTERYQRVLGDFEDCDEELKMAVFLALGEQSVIVSGSISLEGRRRVCFFNDTAPTEIYTILVAQEFVEITEAFRVSYSGRVSQPLAGLDGLVCWVYNLIFHTPSTVSHYNRNGAFPHACRSLRTVKHTRWIGPPKKLTSWISQTL